jgi:hypothetical protein
MSARHRPRPLLGARTATLSDLEMAFIMLYDPHFHKVANSLSYAKDDRTVIGHRDNDYPKAIVLLIGVLSRVCRSLPRAEAMLRTPDTWQAVRKHWRLAKQSGVIGADQPDNLPTKPISAAQWRYMVERIKDQPMRFDSICATFTEAAVDLALDLGYFQDGSTSNPALSSCFFSDGTEIGSQYRSYVEKVVDPATGELRLAAVDPGKDRRIRAWLVQVDERWTAVHPDTGEVLKKMPVDVESLTSCKYGPKQAAYNVVPLSVRSSEPNSRVTVGIDMDSADSEEAKTTLRLIERVMVGRLEGSIQCMITDGILRGVHHETLFKDHGIITVNKVAAAAAKDEEWRDVLNAKGKRIKTLPIRRASHQREDGAPCHHLLEIYDGTLVEVDWDQDGTNMVVLDIPKRLQVKRAQEPTDNGVQYRVSVGYTVKCRHGDFDVWISPHKGSGSGPDNIAENFRVFPEGDPVFKGLYGAGRNTSEGGNAHHKNTYPHKRAQAIGRIPILLDVHLYFIYENAKTWYFQKGWRVVDPLVHGAGPTMLESVLELAS